MIKHTADLMSALLFATLLVAPTGQVAADPTSDEATASAVATAWLGLVDAGNYAAAWARLHPQFQATLEQATWGARLGATRNSVGAIQARRLVGARYASSLPDAPPGEYVVVQFESRFEHRPELLETIVPMRDTDGQWRVAGHFFAERQHLPRQ